LKGAMPALLNYLQCAPNEVLYIGNHERDMRAAVNGGVLFLNGTWYGENINYGFKFSTPKDIAKFIDIFCVRTHDWHFAVKDGNLEYYSLAPFSTMFPKYESYSADARNTAKHGTGHAEFWGRYLCATMFLTGLYEKIKIVAPFPSHTANKWNDPLQDSLKTFAQCFRITYIPDLIVRHTTSPKAQHNAATMNHRIHLNTIRLNQTPIRSVTTGSTYVKSPLNQEKTVLIVDDICTQGFSMEAARVYIERTGAKVVLLSWLKTINRPFQQIASTGNYRFDPYVPTNWDSANLSAKPHPYHATMSDEEAYKELGEKFDSYKTWDWPSGI
jgi:hypothetical protein